MTNWTMAEDLAVAIDYHERRTFTDDELAVKYPRHSPASVRMRLRNMEYVESGGTSGLSNVADQTRKAYAIIAPALPGPAQRMDDCEFRVVGHVDLDDPDNPVAAVVRNNLYDT